MSLGDIGIKYGISKRTVGRINQGIHYAELNENYPIRKKPNTNGKLNHEDVLEIIDILKFSYRTYESIAEEFGVSISTIKNINIGKQQIQKNIQYPIRKFKNSGKCYLTYEQVTEIINIIKTTKISLREIARNYNVDNSTIIGIKNGSILRFHRDNEKYPLRPFN